MTRASRCLAAIVTFLFALPFVYTLDCISPSLPHSAFHVVIAGHAENTCYQYVLDMGLTNALVFVYRRVSPDEPLRTWTGRCGIRVEEKLLVPNHGRDAAAFYDWAGP